MNPVKDSLFKVIQKNVTAGSFDVPKISKSVVNYRESIRKTAKCEVCQYFSPVDICRVVEGEVSKFWVCDAYSGEWDVGETYEIKNWEAFVHSLVTKQPFMLKVLAGFDTPVGRILILEDSMNPDNPHRFSVSCYQFKDRTSKENAWTQDEVDSL